VEELKSKVKSGRTEKRSEKWKNSKKSEKEEK
jgi:hypothetical protein